ncbi:acyl-CoA dehydrogenase family protein [Pantoea sp. 18069]|uniref:acyl-CoA dehydrogenase family protein n=1 Tax=Pantoea sp. 18069 TaxID=2681415 RepID=UPI001358EF5D|nr:acyl-CoA dehydrogenase family protein [Pantoea sp. 18069]
MSRSLLTPGLQSWLQTHAQSLNADADAAQQVLAQLVQAGMHRIAVPQAFGGDGGEAIDAVDAIAQVAERSVTAAFVLWSHRAFIDYLCLTDNTAARELWLPDLLQGRLAGATGLSNAMKFLSQLEPLQVQARPDGDDGLRVAGKLPWVTNLRAPFVVAAAVQTPLQPAPMVLAIDSRLAGVERSADLDLLALRASNTAAIELDDVRVGQEAVLARDGLSFLKRARPMFLSLQCGMSLGLARASLQAAEQVGAARDVLHPRIDQARAELASLRETIREGLVSGRFVTDAPALFRVRLQLAAVVQESVQLELQGSGGRAYLRNHLPDFGRRLQESAFIPVVTPSLTQLQGELSKLASSAAAATPPAAPAPERAVP